MIAFVMTILGWLVAFVMTIPTWLVTVVVLGWLAENIPTVAGLALSVFTLAVGLWVAWGIYHRQQRADEEARKKLKESVAEMVILIISEITGRPVAPEVEARVRRLAKGIIDQVIQMPTLRGGGTIQYMGFGDTRSWTAPPPSRHDGVPRGGGE